MKREWKPGDVAMVRGEVALMTATEGSKDMYVETANGRCLLMGDLPSDARPLVVIDPADEATLRRIGDLLVAEDRGYDEDSWLDLQAALREFANPKPPKPAEPTGQGAVVEDESGARWLRRIEGGRNPWMFYDKAAKTTTAREWDEIAAVRVLSEGVQP